METHSYKIVQENFMDKFDFMFDLFKEHWQESARNKDLMVLNPAKETYRALEESGALFALFAYKNNELVGYSINFITPHMHYQDLICAYNDVIYIHPEHRVSTLGLKIIKETKRVAAEKNAGLMIWHAKPDTSLDKLLPRLGCNVQEIMYTEKL